MLVISGQVTFLTSPYYAMEIYCHPSRLEKMRQGTYFTYGTHVWHFCLGSNDTQLSAIWPGRQYKILPGSSYISTARIHVDPDTKRHIRSRIRLHLLPYSQRGSMVSVDQWISVDLPETVMMDVIQVDLGSDPGVIFGIHEHV